MQKISSPGATPGQEFTEGNPALSLLATEVSSIWLNTIQREIVEVVEVGGGLTLNPSDDSQVRQAIDIMIGLGGTSLNESIDNNQGSPTSIAGLLFDKSLVKAAKIEFDLERFTDTQNVQETGTIYVTHDTTDDVWRLSLNSVFDDAGVVFTINASGQVQYTSDDLTGPNYAGAFRATSIIKQQQ